MVELPEEENLDALIRLSAQVREIFQGEWGHPNLVALNAKDFPDPFIGDADSGVLFMAQMQRHSGLTDIPVKVEFFGDNMVSGGSCSSGACGSSSAPLTKPELRDVDGTWHLLIPQAYLGSPVAFAWLASTTLAQIFCVESLEYGKSLPEPRAAVIEMVACQLGFGGILLEASHIYSKSCGGPKINQMTSLSPEELAFLTACFAAAHRSSLGPLRKSLSLTQKSCLDEAEVWLGRRPRLTHLLETASSELLHGLPVESQRGFFSNLFGRKKGLEEALAGDEQALAALRTELKSKRSESSLTVSDDIKRLIAEEF